MYAVINTFFGLELYAIMNEKANTILSLYTSSLTTADTVSNKNVHRPAIGSANTYIFFGYKEILDK